MSDSDLTKELQRVLADHHGCVQGEGFIVMSSDVYRQTMGVESAAAWKASLEAIAQGHADVEVGRTRPFRDVLVKLGERGT